MQGVMVCAIPMVSIDPLPARLWESMWARRTIATIFGLLASSEFH
jgi:hypothetical protein